MAYFTELYYLAHAELINLIFYSYRSFLYFSPNTVALRKAPSTSRSCSSLPVGVTIFLLSSLNPVNPDFITEFQLKALWVPKAVLRSLAFPSWEVLFHNRFVVHTSIQIFFFSEKNLDEDVNCSQQTRPS